MTKRTRLTTWSSWLAVVLITVGLLPVLDVTAAAPAAGTLRSFYIATGASFGHLSRDIVSVEPVGRDARIRVIQVAAVNQHCPNIQLVTAAERLVPAATVRASLEAYEGLFHGADPAAYPTLVQTQTQTQPRP